MVNLHESYREDSNCLKYTYNSKQPIYLLTATLHYLCSPPGHWFYGRFVLCSPVSLYYIICVHLQVTGSMVDLYYVHLYHYITLFVFTFRSLALW